MKRAIIALAAAAVLPAAALAQAPHDHSAHGAAQAPQGGHAGHGAMDHGAMNHGAGGMAAMVRGSEPADGARLDKAPETLRLDFAHPMAVETARLTNAVGETLPTRLPAGASASPSIGLPALTPDDYRLDWRAKGEDGHVMSGSVRFTVD